MPNTAKRQPGPNDERKPRNEDCGASVSEAVAFPRNALQLRALFLFDLPRFPIMTPIQVKICGVTNREDASACAKLGVALIGLNFYPESPRYIEPKAARQIVNVLPPQVCAVGVFADASIREIRDVAELTGIHSVQLHGDTLPETCSELAREFRVIRAFSTDRRFQPESAAAFRDFDVLVDAHHPDLRGGTGHTCDWSSARATLRFTRFLILSGGLNAQNVGRAIAAVVPHAVDVCSGIESSPGVKDHRALKDFMCSVRIAEQSLHAESADKVSQSVIPSEAKDL